MKTTPSFCAWPFDVKSSSHCKYGFARQTRSPYAVCIHTYFKCSRRWYASDALRKTDAISNSNAHIMSATHICMPCTCILINFVVSCYMKMIPFLYRADCRHGSKTARSCRLFPLDLTHRPIDRLCRRATPLWIQTHARCVCVCAAFVTVFVSLSNRENEQECNWWCVLFSHRFTQRYNQITLSFTNPNNRLLHTGWLNTHCNSFCHFSSSSFCCFYFSPLTRRVCACFSICVRSLCAMCTVTQRLCVYHILIEL